MEKLLTISVAAYNVGAYIKENIESIIRSELRDEIEVFIVDDGGKDRTYEIAKEYEKKYPGIIYAIHKDNGGYGSVQNYTIQRASGKYFKILDGDDYVDTKGLTRLIQYLKETDIDVIANSYLKGPDNRHLIKVSIGMSDDISKPVMPNDLQKPLGMWMLTFKTKILRDAGLNLPEHTLYTDRIYSTIPFSEVNNVIVWDYPVYCYRTGREGQSVSRESRIKHIDEYMRVTEILCRHYADSKEKNKGYLLMKVSAAYKVTIRAMLLLPSNINNYKKLKAYEKRIRTISKSVYDKSASIKTRMGVVLTFLRKTNYWGYWLLSFIPKKIIDY